jgi:hypothetical protein
MEYKIENVEIEKLYRSDTNQEGEKYMSKKGNPFTKVDMYIDPREIDDPDFKGKITFFDYFDNTTNWGVGMPLTGIVSKSGKYFNFQLLPSGKKAVELDIKELEERVKKLEDKVFGQIGHTREVSQAMDMSREMLEEESDEIDDLDLPF